MYLCPGHQRREVLLHCGIGSYPHLLFERFQHLSPWIAEKLPPPLGRGSRLPVPSSSFSQ
ncbi:hypothetical protein BON30_01685 [Cystobacter ferrugineus]|uniref:Uncharacterized protein n=1 Tax=Cystobacter ferrugineus TaxID=83449 RepID=A0A1L9BI39_9BACT|nr:hypothetical protein BON30_01685 [Cystobacter ferrugineus]